MLHQKIKTEIEGIKDQVMQEQAKEQTKEPLHEFTLSTKSSIKPTFFYMSVNFKDNAFVGMESAVIKDSSMYEFEKISGNTAKFKLIKINSALIDTFRNIEPFCESTNTNNNHNNCFVRI